MVAMRAYKLVVQLVDMRVVSWDKRLAAMLVISMAAN